MKLPRLPHRTNIFDAKYSAEQMHEYAKKAINEHMKTLPTLQHIADTQKSIIQKIKENFK